MKTTAVIAALLVLVIAAPVSASEITGVINTGLTGTVGNTLTGTVSTPSSGGSSGGGGGGGGGGGSHSSHASTVKKSAHPSVTVPATTPAAPVTGSVLGAATHHFAQDLYLGLSGQEVTELQLVLIKAGYLAIPAPTGWFGPMTQAAVRMYQAAHGISTTGYVGPLTRGALNAGI